MSETPSHTMPRPLRYPEGFDEQKLDALLHQILLSIDPARLRLDERLGRARHPLLLQQMDETTAMNTEIYLLITALFYNMEVSEKVSNRAQLHRNAAEVEKILLEHATDAEKLRGVLVILKELGAKLVELNPDDDGFLVSGTVGKILRRRLKMPTSVQDVILYTAIDMEGFGHPKGAILKTLAECRDELLKGLTGEGGDSEDRTREEILRETAAVRAYYEAAQIS